MKKISTILVGLVVSGMLFCMGASTVASHSTPQLVDEINAAFANPTNDSITVDADAAVASVSVLGGETNGAQVILQADDGDDAGDSAKIQYDTSNNLNFQTDADSKGTYATKLTMGKTGIVTMKGSATLDNTTSASELNITETNVKVTGNFQCTGTPTLTLGSSFTNSVSASITNLSITVLNGLVTSITINGSTTP